MCVCSCAHFYSILLLFCGWLGRSSLAANQECYHGTTNDLEINFSASFISYSQHISSSSIITTTSLPYSLSPSFSPIVSSGEWIAEKFCGDHLWNRSPSEAKVHHSSHNLLCHSVEVGDGETGNRHAAGVAKMMSECCPIYSGGALFKVHRSHFSF